MVSNASSRTTSPTLGTDIVWVVVVLYLSEIPLVPEDPLVPELPVEPEVPVEPELPDEPEDPAVPDEPLLPDVPDEPLLPEVPKFVANVVTMFDSVEFLISIENELLYPVVFAYIVTLILEFMEDNKYEGTYCACV